MNGFNIDSWAKSKSLTIFGAVLYTVQAVGKIVGMIVPPYSSAVPAVRSLQMLAWVCLLRWKPVGEVFS